MEIIGTSILIVIFAFLIDSLLGDFLGRYHPVCLIALLINFLWEKIVTISTSWGFNFLLEGNNFSGLAKFAGFLITIIVVGVTFTLSYYLASMHFIIDILLIYFALSYKSLVEHLARVLCPLSHGDLIKAREELSKIVGRDVDYLEEAEIARGGIETSAESLCDGIIAPLFFAFIGGAPLVMSYKAVNTLDSMIGYNFYPYKDLGFASAKLDDVLNLIPARLTAVFILITSLLTKKNFVKGLQVMRHDASKHPSPNAGFSESVMAGILNIKLGGVNYYSGNKSFRHYMNETGHSPDHLVLRQAINIVHLTAWIGLAIMASLKYLL
ncbi:adenosylcobinamide-phosphate synthase CbiB [Natranaerobius thermophilus]|uniref:Cobalamin biosynthesis protein CobD n=1 Tax=Natranaerobius thermophilus (strain ATCC BAA-1301 / DSM 18059 / JW/NM-WN-LF) TaxID=457570 RepID=B2A0G4_NATTJ|nr:adenosylcobinamide-phosphate synthase CbiB [Natranaerobius thermophilus]ACB84525.1 cobalamin biosynthesis protein CobD [Natranaerobius thermophilus JW/NM-WN-LF]